MRMACGKSAIAIMAVMMAAVFGCASSTSTKGRSTHSAVEATATGAADSPAASSKAGTKVQEAAFAEDPDGARLVLTARRVERPPQCRDALRWHVRRRGERPPPRSRRRPGRLR